MPTRGAEALARVLEQLGRAGEDRDPRALAAVVWPDFKAAVYAARMEIWEDEASGVRGWRDPLQRRT